MKRIKIVLLMAGAILMAVSCQKPFTPDRNMLYGTWASGDTHYRFDNTYRDYELFDSTTVKVNGAYWNPSDNVSEDEAQAVIWTLDEADITVVKQMYMGGKVPHSYTITALTSTSMTWKDNYNATTTFTKQ